MSRWCDLLYEKGFYKVWVGPGAGLGIYPSGLSNLT